MIKRIAKYFLPLFLVSTILAIWIFLNEKENIAQLELKELSNKSNLIIESLNPVVANIFYWSQYNFTEEDFNPNSNQRFEEELGNFIVGMNHYSQFRLLKVNGDEALRLVRTDDGKLLNEKNLQSKRNENYFRKTIALDSSGIYLSPLNLNVEFGEIEQPYKPMIRGSAPIFSKDGTKLGIVVINFYAKELLEMLNKKLKHSFYLIDDKGKFLSNSDDRNAEFEHLINPKEKHDYATNFPDVWEKINKKEDSLISYDSELWVINTLDFKQEISKSSLIKEKYAELTTSNKWYLISRITNADVFAASTSFYIALLLINLFFLLIIIYVAKAEIKNEKIKKQYVIRLRKKKNRLESQNVLLSSIKNRLELRNRQLKEYNNIVAHNLRAPTTSMSALVYMVSRSNDYEEVKTIIPKLSMITKSINSLVQDLLTYVRVLNDEKVKIEGINVQQEIDKILCLFIETIDGDIKINTDLSEWNTVQFSKMYFQSVMQNLISNAIKYRDPNKLSYINITTSYDKGKKILIIEDNGLGVDLNKYGKRIFKLYERFHRNVSGKGMGLFMVKTQLETLNAEIKIESEFGVGTSFIIRFN